MPDDKPERKLVVRFWRRSLRNYLRGATVLETEVLVDLLADQALGDVEPDYSDLLFSAVLTTHLGLKKRKRETMSTGPWTQ